MNSFLRLFILQFIWLFSVIQLKPVSYGDYQYPSWAIALGWLLGLASILPLPTYMIISLLKTEGSLQEVWLFQIINELLIHFNWSFHLSLTTFSYISLKHFNTLLWHFTNLSYAWSLGLTFFKIKSYFVLWLWAGWTFLNTFCWCDCLFVFISVV